MGKKEIVDFLKAACKKWGLQANYIPDARGGVYFVHKNGRAIQTFTVQDFYQIPKRYRMFMFGPLLHVGLNHNLGEKTKDGLFGSYKLGRKIV